MSDLHFDDLATDDLLLDALGARDYTGADPLAGLLLSFAMACDAPSPSALVRPRRNRRVVLGAFASAAFIVSGAGVAAAMSDSLPTVQQIFAGGAGDGGLLGRLGTLLTAVNPIETAVNVVSGGAAIPDLNSRVLAVPAATAATDPGNAAPLGAGTGDPNPPLGPGSAPGQTGNPNAGGAGGSGAPGAGGPPTQAVPGPATPTPGGGSAPNSPGGSAPGATNGNPGGNSAAAGGNSGGAGRQPNSGSLSTSSPNTGPGNTGNTGNASGGGGGTVRGQSGSMTTSTPTRTASAPASRPMPTGGSGRTR